MTYSPDPTVDPESAATRAHVLLESEIEARISAVRELAKHRNALHAALSAYEDGWQSALNAGWTLEQLRQIGLKEAGDERAPEVRPSIVEPEETYAAPVAIRSEYASETPAPTFEPTYEPSYTPTYEPYAGPVAVPYTS